MVEFNARGAGPQAPFDDRLQQRLDGEVVDARGAGVPIETKRIEDRSRRIGFCLECVAVRSPAARGHDVARRVERHEPIPQRQRACEVRESGVGVTRIILERAATLMDSHLALGGPVAVVVKVDTYASTVEIAVHFTGHARVKRHSVAVVISRIGDQTEVGHLDLLAARQHGAGDREVVRVLIGVVVRYGDGTAIGPRRGGVQANSQCGFTTSAIDRGRRESHDAIAAWNTDRACVDREASRSPVLDREGLRLRLTHGRVAQVDRSRPIRNDRGAIDQHFDFGGLRLHGAGHGEVVGIFVLVVIGEGNRSRIRAGRGSVELHGKGGAAA